MIRSVSLTICFAVCVFVNAQTSFQRTYSANSTDFGIGVKQTSDGGYVLVGSTNGWGITYSAMYIVKTDSAGYEEWDLIIDGDSIDWAHDVTSTLSGDLFVIGQSSRDTLKVIKLDIAGNILWEFDIGSMNGFAVESTSDEGCVIAAFPSPWDFTNPSLIKIDPSGGIDWTMPLVASITPTSLDLKVTPDNGFIVAGTAGIAMSLIRTDSLGNESWVEYYPGIGDDICYGVDNTQDGGFILAGLNEDPTQRMKLIKVDSLGTFQWSELYDPTNGSRSVAYDVGTTSDGGYILTGRESVNGCFCDQLAAVKVDAFGVEQWHEVFTVIDESVAFSVEETSDGGFAFFGSAIDTTDYDFSMYLVKTDGQGVVDIPEILRQHDTVILPNPFRTNVQISGLPFETPYDLFNVTGSLVRSGQTQSGRIDGLDHLPSGYYTLILHSDGVFSRHKLIKE